jgi:hypothetical protein
VPDRAEHSLVLEELSYACSVKGVLPAKKGSELTPQARSAGGRALLAPTVFEQLHQSIGNRAISRLVGEQSKQPPNSSKAEAPPSTGVNQDTFVFEGKALKFDRKVLYDILSGIDKAKGTEARYAFVSRFAALDYLPAARGRPGLHRDILIGMDEVTKQLRFEYDAFCDALEQRAVGVATDLLDASEKTLRDEVKRLGISEYQSPARGIHDEPSLRAPMHGAANHQSGEAVRAAAKLLIPAARKADATTQALVEVLNRLSAAQKDDAFNLHTNDLQAESETLQKRCVEDSAAYDQLRNEQVKSQPSLAL